MPTIVDGVTCYTLEESKNLFDKNVQKNLDKWNTPVSH